MENKKPLILITNDDGYQAKGINELIDSVKGLGEIVVVAPDGPRSGMSSAITSLQPLRVFPVAHEPDLEIYACTGTPVDCVKLGISQVVRRKPDLVITGINHGSNASICVLYSGTMGAAMEGCVFKIPSIGFSLLDHHYNADFKEAKKVARILSEKVLDEGLPVGTCLNVNIPTGNNLKGIKICRQTSGQWVDEFLPAKDGADNDIFWLTGRFDNDEPYDEETDEWSLANGYVSVVPIKVDLTDHKHIDAIKAWEDLL